MYMIKKTVSYSKAFIKKFAHIKKRINSGENYEKLFI